MKIVMKEEEWLPEAGSRKKSETVGLDRRPLFAGLLLAARLFCCVEPRCSPDFEQTKGPSQGRSRLAPQG